MKNNKKRDSKKIVRIFSLVLLTLSLIVGIVFSSLKVRTDLGYGPEYDGSFEASVEVRKDNNSGELNLDKAAKSLQQKLSPFSEEPIQVSKQGKNHLSVIAGKEFYKNNKNNFKNQIQSNGGMFILNRTLNDDKTSQFDDLYTNSKAIEAIKSKGRIKPSEVFSGSVNVKSLSNGNTRSPLINLELTKSEDGSTNLQKIITSLSAKEEQQVTYAENNSDLFFVTDLEELVNNLRYFYINDTTNDDLIETYYNKILKPAQEYINRKEITVEQKKVFLDLFGGTVKAYNTSKNGVRISLLETEFSNARSGIQIDSSNITNKVTGINSLSDLKKILPLFNTDSSNSTSDYVYGSAASIDDIDKKTITNWLGGGEGEALVSSKETFKWITDFFIGNILLEKGNNENKENGDYQIGVPAFNKDIIKFNEGLKNNFIYHGNVQDVPMNSSTPDSMVQSKRAFVVTEENNFQQQKIEKGLYIPSASLTSAKKASASIEQNSLGISYIVESVTEINPYITNVAYLVSIIILSIIALALMIYILFVYRLLGLFTILIAVTSVMLMLLIASSFGILMGPQVIAALFLVISLAIDTNLILFEGFKKNFYTDKRGIFTSFKIGNKETLAIAIDTLLIALIPNVILFWTTSGVIKNFATMSVLGIAIVVILGLLIARFMYWAIMKSDLVSKYNWLLPIDTNYTSFASFKTQYKINNIEGYLKSHENQESYSSKELIKIKKYTDKLKELKIEASADQLNYAKKTIELDKKTISKINKRIAKFTNWKEIIIKKFKLKNEGIDNFIIIKLNEKISDEKYLINLENKTDNEYESNSTESTQIFEKEAVIKKTRFATRGSFIASLVMIAIAIIAGIMGATIGANWNSAFGEGQKFVVYGNQLNNIHEKVFNMPDFIKDEELKSEISSIEDKYHYEMNNSEDKNYVYAEKVFDFLNYVNDHHLYQEVNNKAKHIKLSKAKFQLIEYNHTDSNGQISKKPFWAIQISTNNTNKMSRTNFKRFLVFLAINGGDAWPNGNEVKDVINDGGGIVGYDMTPFTTSQQVKQIAIVFGVLLAALLIYIIIRFKWTYYVALALGIVLTIGVSVASIIIFRIPVSVELLSGIVFLITFTLTTMVLVLGRGKSQLNIEEKENIEANFESEISIASSIRTQKAKMKKTIENAYAPIKKLKKEISKLHIEIKNGSGDLELLSSKENEYKVLLDEFKQLQKFEKEEFKQFKLTKKEEINLYERRNWFFKKLYADLIDYSFWRMITLGAFYIVTAIVLAATMPPIFNMGMIIIIGLIVGFAITLFITIPTWIYFEKRRIRSVYGRKHYIKSLKVSKEEQIVKDIND